MITEDYVSYEVAKLLKEKGFNEPTFTYYNNDGDLMNSCNFCGSYTLGCFNNVKDEKVNCAAPTLQMAMKWLREVHNLHIDVDPSEGNWNPTVLELEDWSCAVKFGDNIPIQDSYEEAVEEAIKYCLTNLI